jgi:diacylglycerol kinase family enzyme
MPWHITSKYELRIGQVFVNVATGGFGAEITESTDSGLKDTLGGASYLLTGLTSPQKLSAKCDAHCSRWWL